MVLITGASGFIGSHLTKKLREEGVPFRLLARSMVVQEELEALGYEAAFGDVTEELSMEQAFEDIDTVVHLVAVLRPTKEHSMDEINRIGTRNVVRAAEKHEVKKIIYMSAVTAQEGSTNLYQLSKWGAEEEIRSSKKLQNIIFRSSIVYGPGGSFTEMMVNFIKKFPIFLIFGKGEARFQPVHVDNVVDALIKAIKTSDPKNRLFELGGPDVLTFDEIVKTFAIVLRKKRRLLHIPLWLAKPVVFILSKLIPGKSPLTSVELELLQQDQIADTTNLLNAFSTSLIPFKEGLRRTLQPNKFKVPNEEDTHDPKIEANTSQEIKI